MQEEQVDLQAQTEGASNPLGIAAPMLAPGKSVKINPDH